VEEVRIGGDAPDVLLKIECVSYEALLDERVIEAETFTDSTCGDICRYIIATYLFEDGFDEGLIEDGITLERYNIDHKTASEVFEELSKLCDFIWYSDQLKQLDFRSATATPAPFEITDENAPITSMSGRVSTIRTRFGGASRRKPSCRSPKRSTATAQPALGISTTRPGASSASPSIPAADPLSSLSAMKAQIQACRSIGPRAGLRSGRTAARPCSRRAMTWS
jgi:hypothetical protein